MSTGFPDPVIRDFAICHGDEVPSRGIDDRVKGKIGNDDQSYDCEKLFSVHGGLCTYLMGGWFSVDKNESGVCFH